MFIFIYPTTAICFSPYWLSSSGIYNSCSGSGVYKNKQLGKIVARDSTSNNPEPRNMLFTELLPSSGYHIIACCVLVAQQQVHMSQYKSAVGEVTVDS
jgi:hypothetical protein